MNEREAPDSRPPLTVVRRQSRRTGWSQLGRRDTALVLMAEAALILLMWQLLVGQLQIVSPVFLPPPTALVDGFATLFAMPDFADHVTASLFAWFAGFLLAVICGTILGVVMGSLVAVERLAGPLVWTLYATPWLAYRPLSTIWFGFGLLPIIFLVFIASLFPVLLNTAAGVRAVEPSLINAGRVFGTEGLGAFRSILLPSSVPFIAVGIRQSAVMATIALIVAEMLGSSVGIGALIAITTNRYQTHLTFALILMTVAWTVGMSQSLKFLSDRIAPWQTDVRLS